MKPKDILWCGEGDLNSRSPLKTRKLYTTQSPQNTRSARSTPPSHTTSHTARGGKRRISCKSSAPGKLMNPHGHYRGLARKLKRRGQAAELESILETRRRVQEFMSQGAPMTFVRSCSCNDGSMPDGSYCPCKIGTFRKQFDDHRRANAAGGQQPGPLHSPAFPISVDA